MKNKKLLKTLLTTVSTMAVMSSGISHAALVGVAANAELNTGVGLSTGAQLADGEILRYAGQFTVTNSIGGGRGEIIIKAIDVSGYDLSGHHFTLVDGQSNVKLGSVVDINLADNTLKAANASQKLKISLDKKLLTLTGDNDSGVVVEIPKLNYNALGEINYAGGPGTLRIDTSGLGAPDTNKAITLPNAFLSNADADANAMLNILTDLNVNNDTFLQVRKIDIAAGKKMHINVGANNAANTANSVYVFGDKDSTLSLEFDTTADHTFTLNKNLVKDGGAPGDEQFTLDIKADHTITVANPIKTLTIAGENGGGVAADQKIGTDAGHRITALNLSGADNITFNNKVDVFAKVINHKGTGTVTFTKAVDSGLASELNITDAGTVLLNAVVADGENSIATVNLGNEDATLEIVAGGKLNGNVLNTAGASGKGIVKLLGHNSEINGAIGATGNGMLKKVVVAGGTGKVSGAIFAKELEVGTGGGVPVDGTITLNGNSEVETFTFHGASAITIEDGKALTVNLPGDITFDPTKFAFGGADAGLAFSAAGADTERTVALSADLDPGAANKGVVTINAANATTKANITTFGLGVGNKLKEINSTGLGQSIIHTAINAQAVNAKVGSTLVFLDPAANTDGGITTIGAVGGAATVVYRPTGDMDINQNANSVVFAHADSVLKLEVLGGAQREFTLKNNLVPTNDNEGILELHASGNNGAAAPGTVFSKLTLQSDGGKAIGATGPDTFLKEIVASGDQQIIITNDVNITNVKKITAKKGSKLTIGSTGTAIADINIGEAGVGGGGATVLVDAIGANITLPAAKAVTFKHADSVFGFTNSSLAADRTVTLARNIETGAADTGILELSSATNTKKLTVQTGGADVNIGAAGGDGLAAVNITGGKVITTTNIKFAKVGSVNVKAGTLQAQSNTVSAHDIIIGNGAVNGTLILDAADEEFDGILDGGKTIKFNTADSELQFLSPGAADKTFTLKGKLIPRNSGGNAADEIGKLRIKAVNGANTLTVAKNANETIGQDATLRLKELIVEAVAGKGGVVITPAVFAKDITVSGGGSVTFSGAVTGGDGGTMKISDATPVTLSTDSSIETVQLNAEDAEIILGNGVTLTGSIDNIVAADSKGKVTFAGAGTVTGSIGATRPLKQITINGNVTIGGNINGAVLYGAVGSVRGGNVTNGVDFGTKDGTYTFTGTTLSGVANTGAADGVGTLIVDNAFDATIGAVGTNKLKKIEFNGNGNVTFTGEVKTQAIEFNIAAKKEFSMPGSSLTGVTVTNTKPKADDALHTIEIDTNQTIDTAFGTVFNPIGYISLAADKTLTIDTNAFFGGVKTTADDQGKVIINQANTNILGLGANGGAFKEVTFAGGDTTVEGKTYAKKVTIQNAKATLTGGLATDELIFSDNNAEATITDNTHLNFDVTTTINGKGKLNLAVTTNDLLVERSIGTALFKLEKVKFDLAADRSVNFNVDAIHGATEFNAGTYNLQKNLEIDGGLTLAAAVLNLDNKDLTVKNGNVVLNGDLKFNTTLVGNKLGQIKLDLGVGKAAVFTNLNSAEITVNDTTPRTNLGTFDFITLNGAVPVNFDGSKIAVTNAPIDFVHWEVVDGGNVIRLKKFDNTKQAVVANTQASSVDDDYETTEDEISIPEFAQSLADSKPGTDGDLLIQQMISMNTADERTETMVKLRNPIASAPAVISATVSTTQSEIGNRMASLSAPVIISADTTSFSAPVLETTTGTSAPAATVSSGNTGSSSGSSATSTQGAGSTGGSSGNTSEGASKSSGGNKGGSSASPTNNDSSSSKDQKKERKVSQEVITGIAAGDNLDRFGVWVNPFYSQGIQKRIFSAEGFKVETVGGSFGVDALVNEDMLVGAALTFASSDLKHKNIKRGDKTKVDTMIGTVYGLYQLNNNLFTQGMLSFGTSDINNNERRRVSSTKFEIANAKYSSTSVGVEGAFGYNLPIANKVIITPTVGLGLSRISDSNYKETGTTAQNLEISKKSITKTDLILGLRGATTPFVINDIAITPEIHGNVRHDLKGDKNRVVARLEQGLGSDRNIISNKATKNSRTSYGFGVGLNANYSYMEYGVGYDVQMSRKYVGQQGSLKVKIRF